MRILTEERGSYIFLVIYLYTLLDCTQVAKCGQMISAGIKKKIPLFCCYSLLPTASGSLYLGGLSAPFLEYSLHRLAAASALFALSDASTSSVFWYRVGDPQISLQGLVVSELFWFIIRVLIFSKTFACRFSQLALAIRNTLTETPIPAFISPTLTLSILRVSLSRSESCAAEVQ